MIQVIYQDESILVVDKPAGLSVLSDGWDPDSNYLVRMLEVDHSKIWVVHRLDKVTSGVMVFALNAEAHRILNKQFETHQTGKIYHALCNGIPKWEQHTARHPLRINVGHSHRTVVDHSKGKPSVTAFTVQEKFGDVALLEAEPATGRTHQVRVHAYALGHPLLGDTLYSAPPTDLIGRPALHALSLSIIHPRSAEPVKFEAPFPSDFNIALDKLRGG